MPARQPESRLRSSPGGSLAGATPGMNLARPGAFNRHLEALFQSV